MKFWRRYWYLIGGILFVFLAFFMGLWGCSNLPRIQTILIFSWMAMLVHQTEEYAFPGGMPSITNMAAFRENKRLLNIPFMRSSVLSAMYFYATPSISWRFAFQTSSGLALPRCSVFWCSSAPMRC